MATNPKDTNARRVVGKFARTLLATTCLTVATGGAALASSANFNEGTSPAPADFANTYASASNLSAAVIPGTTTVNGIVQFGSDTFDFIELTGLGSGTFTVSVTDEGGPGAVSIFTDSASGDTSLGAATAFSSIVGASFGSQAIPGDGNIVLELTSTNEASANYSVTVTTVAGAPEPGTIALAGLGLAGAAALKRRRRKQ